jgi:hypothetical protein
VCAALVSLGMHPWRAGCAGVDRWRSFPLDGGRCHCEAMTDEGEANSTHLLSAARLCERHLLPQGDKERAESSVPCIERVTPGLGPGIHEGKWAWVAH